VYDSGTSSFETEVSTLRAISATAGISVATIGVSLRKPEGRPLLPTVTASCRGSSSPLSTHLLAELLNRTRSGYSEEKHREDDDGCFVGGPPGFLPVRTGVLPVALLHVSHRKFPIRVHRGVVTP